MRPHPRFIFTLALACALLLTGLAGAAKPLLADTSGMVLIYDVFSNGLPGTYIAETAPTWCYHEDSSHQRRWQGTLPAGGSFVTTARFCTYDEFVSGPGGEGFMFEATYGSRQSVSLSIVYPDGTVQQAHQVGDGWLKGCVMPFVEANGRLHSFHWPGVFQIVLTNTGSKAISAREPLWERVWATMGDLWFQQTYCPLEDQNIE